MDNPLIVEAYRQLATAIIVSALKDYMTYYKKYVRESIISDGSEKSKDSLWYYRMRMDTEEKFILSERSSFYGSVITNNNYDACYILGLCQSRVEDDLRKEGVL